MSKDILQLSTAFSAINAFKYSVFVCNDVSQCGWGIAQCAYTRVDLWYVAAGLSTVSSDMTVTLQRVL